MKSTFFCLLFAGFVVTAYGQTNDIYLHRNLEDQKKNQALMDVYKRIYSNDTLLQKKNQMPVLKLELKETYLGNNGRGSDIYAISPDKMPCLKPDKTFRSAMPVALYKSKSPAGIDSLINKK